MTKQAEVSDLCLFCVLRGCGEGRICLGVRRITHIVRPQHKDDRGAVFPSEQPVFSARIR